MSVLGFCVLVGVVLVGLFVAGSLSRCVDVQTNVYVWPRKVHCEPVSNETLLLVDEALSRGGFSDELGRDALFALEQHARKYGGESVVCALVQLRAHYLAPVRLSADDLDAATPPGLESIARASRVAHFLVDNGIEVEGQP